MSTTFWRSVLSKNEENDTSYLPDCNPGMIAENVELTMVVFSPSTSPTAMARSMSAPSAVLLSGASTSIGAYSTSLATVHDPLMLLGSSAAMALSLAGLGTPLSAVPLLLPPAPATPRTPVRREANP